MKIFIKKNIVIVVLISILILIYLTIEMNKKKGEEMFLVCQVTNISSETSTWIDIIFYYNNMTYHTTNTINSYDEYKCVIGKSYYYKFNKNRIENGEIILNKEVCLKNINSIEVWKNIPNCK
jgi:hypothetical protein